VLVLEDEGRRRAFDAGAGVKRSPPSPENGRPKCASRDSCLSRSSIPTPSHGTAGLNLRRPWLPPASISKSASRAWIVATPDRRKFAVRITSYPELDISVPSGRGYRARARGDGRLTHAGWNHPRCALEVTLSMGLKHFCLAAQPPHHDRWLATNRVAVEWRRWKRRRLHESVK
jgi:hypothetical protein